MEDSISLAIVGALSALSIVVSILIVNIRDLVYASALLALLGGLTAAIAAVIGYYLVAAFIIIVYVGAAVMFIIISVSMLGGGGQERRNFSRGLTLLVLALGALLVVLFREVRINAELPVSTNATLVASELLESYLPIVIVLMVALGATVIEAISVARRG